jgi:hypothetical protein
MIKEKIYRLMFHNFISNRIRQIACGWRRELRHGVSIWYKPVKHYPGYGDYDYEPMFERAVRTVRQNRKKFPGKRVAVEVEVFYSGGRPGIGTRLVQYRIKPYRKVF